MRKNMSKALAVSLSIALAAGNTPIGTRYVSAQENPAVWEAQTTAEGEAVTSGQSVEEDTGTNVGGETEETTEVSSEKKEDTSGTVTTENKTEDLQGVTTEGKSETSTTEGRGKHSPKKQNNRKKNQSFHLHRVRTQQIIGTLKKLGISHP